jgi:hypothetical protein
VELATSSDDEAPDDTAPPLMVERIFAPPQADDGNGEKGKGPSGGGGSPAYEHMTQGLDAEHTIEHGDDDGNAEGDGVEEEHEDNDFADLRIPECMRNGTFKEFYPAAPFKEDEYACENSTRKVVVWNRWYSTELGEIFRVRMAESIFRCPTLFGSLHPHIVHGGKTSMLVELVFRRHKNVDFFKQLPKSPEDLVRGFCEIMLKEDMAMQAASSAALRQPVSQKAIAKQKVHVSSRDREIAKLLKQEVINYAWNNTLC